MMDIYQLAVQFDIPRLEQMCVQYLEHTIARANVLEALFHSDNMHLTVIKDYCLSFIVKEDNFQEIVMSQEFTSLDKVLIVEIIRKRLNPGRPHLGNDKAIGTTLESDMSRFLKSGGREFCDINLLLGDIVVPAHKSILAARCSYFQGLFRSFPPPENTAKIQIADITPTREAFNSLLRYIYYGDTSMPPEDSLYLFQAPNYYALTNNRLQAYCKHNLEHNINHDNVLQIFEASDRMQVPDIKKYALRLIVQDYPLVVRSPKMKSLSRDLLLDVIMAVADILNEKKPGQGIQSDI